jgi:hypothetical protein
VEAGSVDGGDGERRYRVVYRDGEAMKGLGRVAGVFPRYSSLDPYLSRLLLEGVVRGELILVDEATGRVAARRMVRPYHRRR